MSAQIIDIGEWKKNKAAGQKGAPTLTKPVESTVATFQNPLTPKQ